MDGCDSLGLEWQNPNSNQIKQKQKTHNSYTYKGYWVAPNVKVALPEPGLRTRVQGHQTPQILSLFITFLAEWGRCLRLLALSSQFSSVSRKTSFSQGFHSKMDPHGSYLGHLPTPWTNYCCWVMVYHSDPIWVICMKKEPGLRSSRGPHAA